MTSVAAWFVEPWTTTATPVFTYKSFLGLTGILPVAVAAGSALLYVLLAFGLAPLIRPQSPAAKARFETCRYAHNVLLFMFSLLCCGSTFFHMLTSGEFNSLDTVLCADPPRYIMVLNMLFTFSKIYEWGDTLFLVWLSPRGANSFLHVYHHATTFWLFLLVSDLPGPLRMGLLLNGFVHTLMYAHYAWPFPKKIVPLITIAQMAQLATVTYLWTITPQQCERFASFPSTYFWEFLTPYAMVPVYLIFFIHFFVNRFLFSSGGSRRRSEKSGEHADKKSK